MIIKPDRHAGQRDPIHGEKPHLTCKDCGQKFTAYYYRMHRGPSDDEQCPSIIYRVQIRATHPYGYRSGEWALITGVEWKMNRPCYEVLFPDGKSDSWPIHDLSDPYEFKQEA